MSQRVSLLMSGPALCLILVSYPYVKTQACGKVKGTRSLGQYTSEAVASFVSAFLGKRSSLRILAGGSSVSSMFRLGWAFLDDHVRSGWPVKPWTNSMLFFHVSEYRSRSVMTVAHSRSRLCGLDKHGQVGRRDRTCVDEGLRRIWSGAAPNGSHDGGGS